MRIAVGILSSAATFFIAGAFGLWSSWALAAATVLGIVGAMVAVTALEERDHAATIGAALTDRGPR